MTEQEIGNYKILKQIGAGGMAKVYLAVHRDIPNLKVILKVLSDPRLVQRFKQEADKLALLDGHPNICRIKHFFTHGEDVVIAMEYIDGVTLDDRLKSEGKLPIAESLLVVINILDILEFAHQQGVYHRDIKPSNIMIDKSGTVKIIDFGIAKGESDPSLTIVGTACGTPAYMAPEQFTPSEDTNYALVDIYATGTTLYRLVTGDLPFKGDNEFALRDAKLFTEPVKPRSLAAGIPKPLEACILRSLEKEPDNRYQSVSEMRSALVSITEEGQAKQAEQTQDFSVTRVKPTTKKSTVGIIAVAAIAILIAVSLYYWLSLGESLPPEAVTLLTPVDGEVFSDNALPTLTWRETAGDGGSYIIEYASDSGFSDGRTIAGVTDGSYTFIGVLPNGDYYWRVYARGSEGLRSEPSKWKGFTVDVATRPTPQGRVKIAVSPNGDIYVDELLLGRRQNRIETTLDTGLHDIRVENRDSREKVLRDTIQIAAEETLTRTYRFTFPPPPEPEPSLGEVRVGSRPPGASIYIDGVLQPQKTIYTFSLSSGRHVIRTTLLTENGEQERIDTIQVVSDSTHKLIFEFE